MTRTERAIIAAYTGGQPVKHILELFSLPAREFYELLKGAGVPLRQHSKKSRNLHIASKRCSGAAIGTLASEFKLSETTIRQILQRSCGSSASRRA